MEVQHTARRVQIRRIRIVVRATASLVLTRPRRTIPLLFICDPIGIHARYTTDLPPLRPSDEFFGFGFATEGADEDGSCCVA